jgi:hypothetical protein
MRARGMTAKLDRLPISEETHQLRDSETKSLGKVGL